eukprot:14526618-Alexandrium_andersonii.AAC.1
MCIRDSAYPSLLSHLHLHLHACFLACPPTCLRACLLELCSGGDSGDAGGDVARHGDADACARTVTDAAVEVHADAGAEIN